MLTALVFYLKQALIPGIFLGSIFVVLLTIFRNAEWCLFLMVSLIPQPNIWFKFHEFPLGSYYLNFLFLAVCLGIVFQNKGFAKTGNVWLITGFVVFSYFALWNSSLRFSFPFPITLDNPLFKPWKNYAMMIGMYFVVMNVIKDEDRQKFLVVIMSMVILFISVRSYRSYTGAETFSSGSRYAGPFWIVGLGSNHLGAFMAHYSSVLIGLFFFDNDKKRRLLYLLTILLSLHPLLFSYSRGAYLGILGALAFYGLAKKRWLLVAGFLLFLLWQTILPASVVDRIKMTESAEGELEHSAAVRLDLWNKAVSSFEENPIFGIGFDGFRVTMRLQDERYGDTHNIFLKTLCEQGIIGVCLLACIIFAALRSGYRLLRAGKTPFHRGLGFGFLGCVIAVIVTNMFGDRWSYIELGSYFWVFWALVDRGILISKEVERKVSENNKV